MNQVFRCAIAVIFMVVALVAPPGSAVAGTGPFYFGIFGGYTFPQNMTWHSKTSGDNLDLNVDNTAMLGFKLGYILPEASLLAFELEITHIFDHNYGPAGTSSTKEAGDVYLHNLFFNLLLRHPKGAIHPFVGAGIGPSFFNLNNVETFGGITYLQRYSAWTFAWQFLGGVNFEIAPNLSVDLTYRYLGTDPHFPAADVEYRTSVVSAGINFHF